VLELGPWLFYEERAPRQRLFALARYEGVSFTLHYVIFSYLYPGDEQSAGNKPGR